MSRSATPATRNEATTRLKPPKMTTSAELPIGTAIRGSHERLRTVADGCGRGGNVERTHPQPPDPQSETGTLATHSGNISLLDFAGNSSMIFLVKPPGLKLKIAQSQRHYDCRRLVYRSPRAVGSHHSPGHPWRSDRIPMAKRMEQALTG